jgi:hypothetical protein
MKMVQVTSEAKASPTITALTRISADMNIDHGDSSCSAAAVDFSDLPVLSAAAAGAGAALKSVAGGGGADCTAAGAGAACTGTSGGEAAIGA